MFLPRKGTTDSLVPSRWNLGGVRLSWRMVRVEGIEAVDLVVGSPTFAAKGAAKRWGTLAGFRAPPSIWRFRLAALAGRARRPSLHESFGGVTGFFLDGAK